MRKVKTITTRLFGTNSRPSAVNKSGEIDRIPAFGTYRRDKPGYPAFTAPTGLGPVGEAMATYGRGNAVTQTTTGVESPGFVSRRDVPGGPVNLAAPKEVSVAPSGGAQIPDEDRTPNILASSRAFTRTRLMSVMTTAGNVVNPIQLARERTHRRDYISAGDAVGLERTAQLPPLHTTTSRAQPASTSTGRIGAPFPTPLAAAMAAASSERILDAARATTRAPITATAPVTAPTGLARETVSLSMVSGLTLSTTAITGARTPSPAPSLTAGPTSNADATPVEVGALLASMAGAAPTATNAGAANAIVSPVEAAVVRADTMDITATVQRRESSADVEIARLRGTTALMSSGGVGFVATATEAPDDTPPSMVPQSQARLRSRLDRIYNPASPVFTGRMTFGPWIPRR